MPDDGDIGIVQAAHPLLEAAALRAAWPAALGDLETGPAVRALLRGDAAAPLAADDAVRAAVRALLRHGGFKPKGRSKPAPEYLARAVAEGSLAPINPAVDLANAVSLHGGLALSVLDEDRLVPPLRVDTARAGESFVFNPAGQVIELEGLVGLRDGLGPCANAVKDAQRTKTGPGTRRTLTVVWGTRSLPGRTQAVLEWCRALLEATGATVAPVPIETAD